MGGITFFRNPVFPAELLPELEANLVATLPQLEHDHLTRHDCSLSFSANIISFKGTLLSKYLLSKI